MLDDFLPLSWDDFASPADAGDTIRKAAMLVTGGQRDPWHACIVSFLQSMYERSQSDSTLRQYKNVLSSFFSDHPDPAKVRKQDIEAFLRKPGVRTHTVGQPPSLVWRNQRLCVLSSFYRFAASWIPDGSDIPILQKPSPTLGIKWLKVLPKPRAMSKEQLPKFFAAIAPRSEEVHARNYALFFGLLLTARRREEWLRLKYGDIEPYTFVEQGKAPRPGFRYRYTAKYRAGQYEWAELPQGAMQAITAYLQVSGRASTILPDDYIFISTQRCEGERPGERYVDGNTAIHHFKAYLRKAGLPSDLVIHSLRHSSAATRFELSNGDLLGVSKVLGHASVGTTHRYINSLVGQADPIGSKLSEAFSDL